ncbi:MAG: metal ABC transporter permease [Planctomycetes bacterium]|nr:metal ABC transporter permease [Planctomycetota bacterium]
MSDLLRLITLQDANTRVVLLGAALLGLAAGVVGTFAVLRRRALVGDAMAHAALPGVCLAYFVVGERNFAAFLIGAFIAGLIGAGCIVLIRAHTRIKEDAAIGIVLASFFGLGISLSSAIQQQPSGNRAGLDTFIFGKAASMVRSDVVFIGVCAAAIVAIVAVLARELGSLCFDRGFSASIGRPVVWLDFLLMGLICLCAVIGLPAAGVVMTAAMLTVPAAAARFWTDHLRIMLVLSGVFGIVSGVVGVGISALRPGLAAGPLVVLVAGVIFVVSLIAAPRRGVAAAWWRRRSLRRRVLLQNLLRAMHELLEGSSPRDLRESELLAKRAWTTTQLTTALRRASRMGLAQPGDHPHAWRLTPAGVTEAASVTRAHRLWELFLIEQAEIAADHVDRDADQIEHVLPHDVIAALEARLVAQGRLPASPHAIPVVGSGGPHA